MKSLMAIMLSVFALTAFAADAPKKVESKPAASAPAAKKEPAKKAEKCVPSKDVVCDKNLQGKTRPTPKKKVEETKTTK